MALRVKIKNPDSHVIGKVLTRVYSMDYTHGLKTNDSLIFFRDSLQREKLKTAEALKDSKKFMVRVALSNPGTLL